MRIAPLAVGLPIALLSAGSAARAPLDAGLQALHVGDYRSAIVEFRRAADSDPGAPDPVYLLLFSRWSQRAFEEGEDTKTDPVFDAAYDELVRVAEARLAQSPKDADTLAALGGGQVLRAQVEAVRGNYFRAGREARQGKKALERALAISPSLETALFPMGALNYYADRVPLLIKGIRPLLFIPGGDSDLGLRQIKEVADRNGRFQVEARLLFGILCADRYQKRYAEAVRHFERAAADSPESPVVRAALGSLWLRIGDDRAAEAAFQDGLELATGVGIERARQRRWLWLGVAEARVMGWRLSDAEAALQKSGEEAVSESNAALDRARRRIEEEVRQKRAAFPAVTGSGAPSREQAEAAAKADASSPVAWMLVGQRRLEAADVSGAKRALDQAAGLLRSDAPAWLQGSLALLQGRAESALGRTRQAHAAWDRAAGVRRFRNAEQARLLMGEPGAGSEICVPGEEIRTGK